MPLFIIIALAVLVVGYAYEARRKLPVPKQANELVVIENAVSLKDGKGWTHQRGHGIDSIVGTLTKSGIAVSYDYGMYGHRPGKTAVQLEANTRDTIAYELFLDKDPGGDSLILLAYRQSDQRQYFAGSIRQTDEAAVNVAKELLATLALSKRAF